MTTGTGKKIGNGSMPIRVGNLINAVVHGGPYRDLPDGFFGVKMAKEIITHCDVNIPTADFDGPQVSDLREGVVRALMAMINGEKVYAGCMGGIGRTGLFLAALAKVQIEYRKAKHRSGRGEDPVLYVRKHFIPHAVETNQQKEFIADFDVADIVSWLDVTQTAMGRGGLTPAREAPPSTWVDPEWIADVQPEWIPEEAKAAVSSFPSWEQFESLQSRLDELQEQLDAVETSTEVALEITHKRIGSFMGALRELSDCLTKPTLIGRLQVWLRNI